MTVDFYERTAHSLISKPLSYLKVYLALMAAEHDNTLGEIIKKLLQ